MAKAKTQPDPIVGRFLWFAHVNHKDVNSHYGYRTQTRLFITTKEKSFDQAVARTRYFLGRRRRFYADAQIVSVELQGDIDA